LSDRDKIELDYLDLRILDALLTDARATFKELAKNVDSNQKMVARRIEKLVKLGIIKSFTIEVDWAKLGLNCIAYMGTRTAPDVSTIQKLYRFIEKEPRIIRADATVGVNEYILLAIDRNVETLRENVATPLEPLTSGISTSIVTKNLKLDYKSIIKLLKE